MFSVLPLLPCSNFNSRPREGANSYNYDTDGSYKFQFPPPRGGEPFAASLVSGLGGISIPAPARGRTAKLHKIEQSILSVC